jgi:hypothetical protein
MVEAFLYIEIKYINLTNSLSSHTLIIQISFIFNLYLYKIEGKNSFFLNVLDKN